MTSSSSALELPPPRETPLLRSGNVLVKPELWQWTQSVKYRMAYAKVERAIGQGLLLENTTLVEVTSGSTGAALAFIGRTLGLGVELHAYESISPRRRAQIEGFGAKVVLHPSDTPVDRLLEMVRSRVQTGGTWHLDQYDRDSTAACYDGLADELLSQLRDAEAPEAFVCPVGTGGLIQGVGARLRKEYPGIRVVAVEPAPGVSIEGTRNTDCLHLGELDPYDRDFPDEVLRVPHPDRRSVGGVALGESASAALAVLEARTFGPAVIVGPD